MLRQRTDQALRAGAPERARNFVVSRFIDEAYEHAERAADLGCSRLVARYKNDCVYWYGMCDSERLYQSRTHTLYPEYVYVYKVLDAAIQKGFLKADVCYGDFTFFW